MQQNLLALNGTKGAFMFNVDRRRNLNLDACEASRENKQEMSRDYLIECAQKLSCLLICFRE